MAPPIPTTSRPRSCPTAGNLLFCGFGEHHGVFSVAVDAPPGAEPRLVTGGSCAGLAYVGPGYLLVMRDGTLTAQAFDSRTLHTSGDPFAVVDQPFTAGWFWDIPFTASSARSITYGAWGANQDLRWFDRSGKDLGTVAPANEYGGNMGTMSLAPDGNRLVVSRTDRQTQNIDIWVLDIARAHVVADQLRSGGGALCRVVARRQAAGLRIPPQQLPGALRETGRRRYSRPAPGHDQPRQWPLRRPDGRDILYFAVGPTTGADLWIAPADGSIKPYPLVQTQFNETCGQFSSDGRFLAYTSDETGTPEAFMRPVSRAADGRLQVGDRRWQISNGGMQPRWRHNGRELFYLSQGGQLMSVAVKPAAAGLEFDAPTALFHAPIAASVNALQYAVTPDGQRFLVVTRPPTREPVAPHVTNAWFLARPPSKLATVKPLHVPPGAWHSRQTDHYWEAVTII